jgi:hypothetical protein
MLTSFVLALPAFAEPVPVSPQLPDAVPMYTQIVILKGAGRTKGADCAGALALAMQDLEGNRGKYAATHLIGVYETYEPNAPVATSVECKFQGKEEAPKKSVVKVEGLGINAGSGPEYAVVTTERAGISAAAALMAAPTMALLGNGAREAWDVAEPIGSDLFYPEGVAGIGEGFLPEHNRSTRAATVFNRAVLPALDRLAAKAEAVPEIDGVVVYSSTTHPNAEWEPTTEAIRFVLTTGNLLAYRQGGMAAQELLDKSVVQYDAGVGWAAAPVQLASALD